MAEGRGHGPNSAAVRARRDDQRHQSRRGDRLRRGRVYFPAVVQRARHRGACRGTAAVSKTDSRRVAGEQRIYRELQEGLLEAERIRAETGGWPDVAALEAEGIPPFAADPTQKIDYKWTSVRQDWATNYLGVPSDASQPRGCSSFSSPSLARPRIRRRTTKRITGCPTGRRCTYRSGICRKTSAAAASPRCGCRRMRAGQTGWWGKCAITIAVSTKRRRDAENIQTPGRRHAEGNAENTHFSAGCVRGLAGGRRLCAEAHREKTTTAKQEHSWVRCVLVCRRRVSRALPRAASQLDAVPAALR